MVEQMTKEPRFHGMHPWGVQSEIIYCEETVIGEVDLHNFSDFLGVEKTPNGDEVYLLFERMGDRQKFEIRFKNAQAVEISRVESYDPEDETTFYAFDSPGGGVFEFETPTTSGRLQASEVWFNVLA